MSTSSRSKKMEYVRLGQSGLKVSRIILGMMTYGDRRWEGWVLGEEEGIAHVKAAYEMGIQTFDTANMYSNGRSEEILGKAIKELHLPRDEIVVMTKVYGVVGRTAGDRKHIFESVKHSLKRLQLDYVDVLQCHRFDSNTPIAETMRALHDVVQAGYARYIGMSSCYAYQFHAMQNYAITNKLTPLISMQNYYSLAYREEEREMMPTLKMFGVGSIPWAPLSRGYLTRPLSQQSTRESNDPLVQALNGNTEPEIINRVEAISKMKGVSMAQVAIAWILTKDVVSAPIVGIMSLKNLEDIAGAINVKLTEEEVKQLEEPYKPQAIMGH
ncbi:aldo/keto reductase family protein [Ceratobasidium sp. AG-Ba]|nr:aldo/keto reductase family protein [Ceratobasidium sp. AG-Ba]